MPKLAKLLLIKLILRYLIEIKKINTKEAISDAFVNLNSHFSSTNHPIFSFWLKASLNEYVNGNRLLFGIKEFGNDAGFILIHKYRKVIKLNALVIFPEYRRKEIGLNSCLNLINRLRSEEVKLIFTQIRPYNESAIKLIEKLNFEEVGTVFHLQEDKENILYVLKIAEKLTIEEMKKEALNVYSKHTFRWIK